MRRTIELEITRTEKVAVRYLQAECGVRYWEGNLVRCREGDNWRPDWAQLPNIFPCALT